MIETLRRAILVTGCVIVIGCDRSGSRDTKTDAMVQTAASATTTATTIATTTKAVFELANVGFAQPESVLHDEVDDVYLVTNINGDSLAHDNNGFVSRIT